MKWRLGPIGLVRRIEKLLFWSLGFEIVLERENYIASSCIFSQRIVKSLQLHGRKQIAKPHKYYLVLLFSLAHIFLYFLYLINLGILLYILLQLVLKPRFRFK